MPIWRAREIQSIRIGELRRIAVSSTDAKMDARARRHIHTADFGRLNRDAITQLI